MPNSGSPNPSEPLNADETRQMAKIGVLMLDTHFNRIPGDVGNSHSWSTPVLFKTVKGANPANVVFGGAEGLLDPFIKSALELVDEGARAITTSCGFLAIYQKELAAALPVPIFASSLMQAPLIKAILPADKQVGILTFSAQSLTERHLVGAGADPETPIQGVKPDSKFAHYYGNRPDAELDFAQFETDVLEAAETLVKAHPNTGAILCECTNLPPHSRAIAEHTGLPVYDIMGFVDWMARSLRPTRY
ncbi:aspartate/glutamate racemase family protein [uncultured Cohaesibacter sp.]|uniref:aspartate/glutamate racemase family protein n=1 Tax=uncultured Cohaesibacter sp. TaxID=1002546 RepID=UPI0029C6B5F3|nr:aspartate/glutamate racemase family protein [uncultured Cohaesibacter sp.]